MNEIDVLSTVSRMYSSRDRQCSIEQESRRAALEEREKGREEKRREERLKHETETPHVKSRDTRCVRTVLYLQYCTSTAVRCTVQYCTSTAVRCTVQYCTFLSVYGTAVELHLKLAPLGCA